MTDNATNGLVGAVDRAYFVGQYVDEMAKLTTVSLLAGTHAIAISGPGTGKTAIFESVARDVAHTDWCMVRCDPSTPPEKIKGAIDVQRYLQSGEFAEKVDGTPFDPTVKVVILDEMTRASDVVHNLNIQTLDRGRGNDAYKYPVVWGTANFVKTSAQIEALLDRIALWFHIPDEEIDNLEFVKAQVAGRKNGGLHVRYPLPCWNTIQEVRGMDYGMNAVKAVAAFMDLVIGELGAKNIRVNRRRREQWQRILLAASAYETGSGDFSHLSPLALEVFKYAWSAPKPEDQIAFQSIIAECSNPVQHAIDQALAEAVVKLNELNAIQDKSERLKQIGKLGEFIGETQTRLQASGADLETLSMIQIKLAEWYSRAIKGEHIEE